MLKRVRSLMLLVLLLQMSLGTMAYSASQNFQYEYVYDSNNQLIGIKQDGEFIRKYYYDSNGNLITIENLKETTSNLLNNASFERVNGTQTIGWQGQVSGTGAVENVASPVYSGSRAVKIHSQGLGAWEKSHIRQEVMVQGGQAYTLSGHVKVEQLTKAYAQLLVRFFDQDWNHLGDQEVKAETTTSGYMKLERKGQIPAAAVRAEVIVELVSTETGGAGVVYADAMSFEYGADDNLVSNGGFEYSTGADMSSWRSGKDSSGTGAVTVVEQPVKSGTRALKIEAAGLNAWHNAQVMQEFEVEGGQGFKLSGEVQVSQLEKSMAAVQVTFLDENNQYIVHQNATHNEVTTGFIHVEQQGIVPANAKRAQIHVWLVATEDQGGGVMYFDDISFTYEAPTSNLLSNPDFEYANGTQTIGWQGQVSGTGAVENVASPVYSGSRAVKIHSQGLGSWEKSHIRQEVMVQGGQAYTLSGHVKVEQLTKAYAQLLVRFFDQDWNHLGDQEVKAEATTSGYMKLERKGQIPAAAVRAEVIVELVSTETGGAGVVYADAMSFEYGGEIEPGPAESETVTVYQTNNLNNFPDSIEYDQGGYKGILTKVGAAEVLSGTYSPAESRIQSYSCSGEWFGVYNSEGIWKKASETLCPDAIPISSNGFQGVLIKTSTTQMGSCPVSGTPNTGCRVQLISNYSGTVTKPEVDTRVWRQSYSGTVYLQQ
ncbi:hypothetical protein D3P09_26325 [Paenibacillus pinisoli]|uniref:RHS repeat protein n=1 Tax=Paenibacillus pinisoli TaxID=1276110 RepID=A0A3A6PAT1_9BACL|nr:hypothetical protein [Paenibacillus pinisoli]RJX36756.1 hypothetical protein D3P09_26325 [Paenibacillus pinisoli]